MSTMTPQRPGPVSDLILSLLRWRRYGNAAALEQRIRMVYGRSSDAASLIRALERRGLVEADRDHHRSARNIRLTSKARGLLQDKELAHRELPVDGSPPLLFGEACTCKYCQALGASSPAWVGVGPQGLHAAVRRRGDG